MSKCNCEQALEYEKYLKDVLSILDVDSVYERSLEDNIIKVLKKYDRLGGLIIEEDY